MDNLIFLLVVITVAIIMLIVWKLPTSAKPKGLASAWRWIAIATTLEMYYEGIEPLRHYTIISPILWTAFVVLMCCAIFSAAKQNCKSVWGRLLACLLLDIAITVVLPIIFY